LERRAFLQEKRSRAHRFELMLGALAVLCFAALPIGWILHGFDGVQGGWNPPLTGIVLAALSRWAAHFRRKAERRLRDWDAMLDRRIDANQA
jgi:hypothetical protein